MPESQSDRPGLYHHLWFGRNRTWFRLLARHWRQIDRRHLPRAVATTLAVTLSTPLRLAESAAYTWKYSSVEVTPPLWIVGHWRSGTTNLQHLLLQDDQFGIVSLRHCVVPDGYLYFSWLYRLFAARKVPQSRPMDNVPTGLEAPMSEDFALSGLSDLSHYSGYYFPNQLEETFRRTVLFEGVTQEEIDRWCNAYVRHLAKVSIDQGGKRLLLKNPPNAGRMRQVWRTFPDSQFIHQIRDPFAVYKSTVRLAERFAPMFGLSTADPEQLRRDILRRQRLLYDRYYEEAPEIPESHRHEVRHEDVVADPVGTVEEIYDRFALGDFEAVRPRLEAYAESQKDYQNNRYHYTPDEVAAVTAELEPYLERWGYEPPPVGKSAAISGTAAAADATASPSVEAIPSQASA